MGGAVENTGSRLPPPPPNPNLVNHNLLAWSQLCIISCGLPSLAYPLQDPTQPPLSIISQPPCHRLSAAVSTADSFPNMLYVCPCSYSFPCWKNFQIWLFYRIISHTFYSTQMNSTIIKIFFCSTLKKNQILFRAPKYAAQTWKASGWL